MNFPLLDQTTAPADAVASLATVQKNFGMIPNFDKVIAQSPQLLSGYVHMWDLFETTDFTAIEKQIVYLTINFENECNYCVPWHTLVAQQAGMPPKHVEALRSGGKISDEKLEALRTFTRTLMARRGRATPAELKEFVEAGYVETDALNVILALSIKLISNYSNAIAGTPLDKEVEHLRWQRPHVEEQVAE